MSVGRSRFSAIELMRKARGIWGANHAPMEHVNNRQTEITSVSGGTTAGSTGTSARTIGKRQWAVYLVNGDYYISTWTALPFGGHVPCIDKFMSTGKEDALARGQIIIDAHKKGLYSQGAGDGE